MSAHTDGVSAPPIDQFITFLPAKDLGEVDRFYSGVLGLDLALDQGTCRIYKVGGGAFVGFCEGSSAIAPARAVILTLVTEDVAGWFERLDALGAPTDGAPRVNPQYQIEHFFATDPNGYRVEVQRFLDPRWGG